jgi:CheY-like chemotaxis protein
VIALTGHTDAADIEKAQAAGFTAHLTKPLKKAALLEAIQRYAVSSSDKESAA